MAIIEFLSDAGVIPSDLKELIMSQQDLPILTKWLKLASRSNSIEEFMERAEIK